MSDGERSERDALMVIRQMARRGMEAEWHLRRGVLAQIVALAEAALAVAVLGECDICHQQGPVAGYVTPDGIAFAACADCAVLGGYCLECGEYMDSSYDDDGVPTLCSGCIEEGIE